MSRKVQTYGTIKSGKLGISYRDQFITALSVFPDCRVRVTVEKIYRKRSLEQNKRHFGVICYEYQQGAKEEWGEDLTIDECHEQLKLHCNSKQVLNKRTGELISIPQSTRNYTTVEFCEFNLRCEKLIAEYFGRTIPEEGEQTEMEFNQ